MRVLLALAALLAGVSASSQEPDVREDARAAADAGIDLAASGASDLLLPLAVSKVTSSMREVAEFYEGVLLARELEYADSDDSAFGKVYLLHEGEMVVRFVQSHAGAVKNLENLKKLAETYQSSGAPPAAGAEEDEDVPDLVDNFEEAAK